MSTHWALRLIHFLYISFVTITAWVRRRKRRRPKPLDAQRSKIPEHLCLNLVTHNDIPGEEIEATFLQCLQNVAAWCRALGIETLTVYDRHGVLYGCSEEAYRRVFLVNETQEDSCDSELEFPLTPPRSDTSGSRPHSPEHVTLPVDLNVTTMMHSSRLRKRRNVAARRQPDKDVSSTSKRLMLHIVSRASGKPAIASVSRSLLQNYVSSVSSGGTMRCRFPYKVTVSRLAAELEASLPPPDLMIIHHTGGAGGMGMPYPPIEFHGFPPWQNTLTEFHRTHPDDSYPGPSHPGRLTVISEIAFRRALDEYSGAEFRLGR